MLPDIGECDCHWQIAMRKAHDYIEKEERGTEMVVTLAAHVEIMRQCAK